MNPETVRQALERFERPLLEFGKRITGDLESARDVVQDTFLKLCRVDPSSESDVTAHLAEWLFTVCRHQALDQLRKEQAMRTREKRVSAMEPIPGGTSEAEQRDDYRSIVMWLDKLPGKQAEALRLKFQGGLSYVEIGRVMGETIGNVGWLIHEGIKKLRERAKTSEVRA